MGYSAHISLQSSHTHAVHRTLKLTVCRTVALQAVVAEDVATWVRHKRHQNLADTADWTGAKGPQQLCYVVAATACTATTTGTAAAAIVLTSLWTCGFQVLLLLVLTTDSGCCS